MDNTHWNFFLAIEEDLEKLTRYVEFSEDDNMNTYSIQLSYILLSSCSEIDVLLKAICNLLDKKRKSENIDSYRLIIQKTIPEFITEEICIGRYKIFRKPWNEWKDNSTSNPDWWIAYNNVKHHRDKYYSEANLKNTISAVGALSIVVLYYYKLLKEKEVSKNLSFREITEELNPRPNFIWINADYYHRYITD